MSSTRVGFARRDITPPLGSPSSLGLYVAVDEIWDPLTATAVVLDSGGTRMAVVCLDLCGLLEATHRRLRIAVEAGAAIPSDLVVLDVSHTHSAPYLSSDVQDMLRPHGLRLMDDAYVDRLEASIVEAVVEAVAGLESATVAVGRGAVDRVAANRRPIGPDGLTVHRYGRPPDDLRDLPEGLIDPDVAVVRFDRPDGTAIGALMVYACHPTAAGGGINRYVSADFVGAGRAILESEHGVPFGFLQGCAGNQGTGKWIRGTAQEDVLAMGERFAAGVDAALGSARPVAGSEWRFDVTTVPLDFESFPPVAALEGALLVAIAGGDDGAIMAIGDQLAVARRIDTLAQARITTVVLGDLALTILPGEVFLEHGLAIRAASPFGETIVAAYNDNTPQYIPTIAAFEHGEYEVEGGWRYVRPGGGERLALDAIESLRRLAASRA